MTDNINPEYQHPNENTPTPAPAEKKGNGLAVLALLVGAVGAGIGVYNTQQVLKHQTNYADGQDNPAIAQLEVAVQQQGSAIKSLASQEQVSELSQKVTQLSQAQGTGADVAALESQFASAEQVKALADQVEALSQSQGGAGVDRAELEQMVTNAIAASQLTPEQVKEMAGGENGVTTDQVQSLINQSLANLSQGDHQIDLTKEIDAMKASEASAQEAAASAQAALAQVNEAVKAAEARVSENAAAATGKLDEAVDQKLATLQQALGEVNNSASNPYPLLNALKLAQLAAQEGNLIGARNYLAQAKETFSLFDLTESSYSDFQGAVEDLYNQYADLAGKASPASEINTIIDQLSSWNFKTVDPIQNAFATTEPSENDNAWTSAIKGVGQSILNNTITVTPIDDAGLAWINADQSLQSILRENVRLDLAFLRNALQLGNMEDYNTTADRLSAQISHYFNSDDQSVASALQTLSNLKAAPKYGDNISALIKRIEQTK